MPGLTYTFTGPDGQTVRAVDGVVTVAVGSLVMDLEDAAARRWPVTPTGPWWLGGEGIENAASVYWAVRHIWPTWTHTGDAPEPPEIPAPEPGVVY